jgi:hypothetical protein
MVFHGQNAYQREMNQNIQLPYLFINDIHALRRTASFLDLRLELRAWT